MLVLQTAKHSLSMLSLVILMGQGTLASAQSSNPDAFYCDERKLGHYFYCSKDKIEPEAAPEPVIITQETQPPTAMETLASIREELDELRAVAILEPSATNVRNYIAFQRQQLDRASAFSDSWRRVIWSTPSLDYTLQRPVGALAKRRWGDERIADQRQLLATLSDRYGLFYFYAGSCTACIQFSPVLKSLADTYGIHVKAVSVDGGSSSSFPDAVRDQGHMDRMGLGGSPTPALALFDTETQSVIPVGFGFMSQSELEDRIYILTQKETGEDY